jgi:hypothetical protein
MLAGERELMVMLYSDCPVLVQMPTARVGSGYYPNRVMGVDVVMC